MPNFFSITATHIAQVVEGRADLIKKAFSGTSLTNVDKAGLLSGHGGVRSAISDIASDWVSKMCDTAIKAADSFKGRG